MNEVEKHYSGQETHTGSGATGPSDGTFSSVASKAKSSASAAADAARRRSADGIDQARRSVEDFVETNPIMLGVAGLAAGLLVGALLPGTRRENAAFGRYADEVRDQGLRYARDLAEQGRHFVEESLAPEGAGHG